MLTFEECLNPSPTSQDGPASPFQYSANVANVSSETRLIHFKALQSQVGQNISHQLFDEMKRLHVTFVPSNPRRQDGGAPDHQRPMDIQMI
ncbi:hypothetical protein AQUCO_00100815v1 [Aquilegia coerulea]|uniref:Uncharacterized protein n=1 Tax=Aquilegia coerulea TaxID=218851 RepID=A0A2G5FC34_AQUCA|nr:hypothetical protein AQUCO_00100815v1 [Aquilegia coerulea]